MLDIVERGFPGYDWSREHSPFEVLIAVILSQNTNDRNVDLAMERLAARYKITPQSIAKADLAELKKCLRPAGLQRIKAARIKGVARKLLADYGGKLDAIFAGSMEEARGALLGFDGIGEKTADVVLNFLGGWDTLAIDTHIARVAKRLEVVGGKAGYGEIKAALEELIPEGERRKAHLSIIQFGRRVCKARDPMCPVCPLNGYCNWWRGRELPSWKKYEGLVAWRKLRKKKRL